MYHFEAVHEVIYDGHKRKVQQIAVYQDGRIKMLLGWQSDHTNTNPVPELIEALEKVRDIE